MRKKILIIPVLGLLLCITATVSAQDTLKDSTPQKNFTWSFTPDLQVTTDPAWTEAIYLGLKGGMKYKDKLNIEAMWDRINTTGIKSFGLHALYTPFKKVPWLGFEGASILNRYVRINTYGIDYVVGIRFCLPHVEVMFPAWDFKMIVAVGDYKDGFLLWENSLYYDVRAHLFPYNSPRRWNLSLQVCNQHRLMVERGYYPSTSLCGYFRWNKHLSSELVWGFKSAGMFNLAISGFQSFTGLSLCVKY
mgnify:CR=1 FL=1